LTQLTDTELSVDGDADAALWVSIAEAGRRQEPPVSREAARKRVKQLTEGGRLRTKPGPRGSVLVNLVAYLRAVRDETDPAQDLRNGRTPAPEMPDDDEDDGDAPGGAGYLKSRARREAFNAENARLDLDERLDRLADKDDVEHRTMQIFRMVRDRLLGMPSSLADRVAAQPDARAVRALLQTEIRRVLDSLANALDQLGDEDSDIAQDAAADADE
jgi:hypothetical protein